MAKRASEKKLTTSELIVQKLKETFDRSGGDNTDTGTVWVMAVAATSLHQDLQNREKNSCEQKPLHRVRVVLRTSDPSEGANPYVDGSDFFLEVSEQRQTAEFVWEDDSFANAPLLHGSDVLTAIQWAAGLTDSLLCIRLKDPFLNETKQQNSGSKTNPETKGDEEA